MVLVTRSASPRSHRTRSVSVATVGGAEGLLMCSARCCSCEVACCPGCTPVIACQAADGRLSAYIRPPQRHLGDRPTCSTATPERMGVMQRRDMHSSRDVTRGMPGRRLVSLGQVKAPKPLNLPSQKQENHGLDPTVHIVPKVRPGSSDPFRLPAHPRQCASSRQPCVPP